MNFNANSKKKKKTRSGLIQNIFFAYLQRERSYYLDEVIHWLIKKNITNIKKLSKHILRVNTLIELSRCYIYLYNIIFFIFLQFYSIYFILNRENVLPTVFTPP